MESLCYDFGTLALVLKRMPTIAQKRGNFCLTEDFPLRFPRKGLPVSDVLSLLYEGCLDMTLCAVLFICLLLDSVQCRWRPSIDFSLHWIKPSSRLSIFISWLFVSYVLEVIKVLTVKNIFVVWPYKNAVPLPCSHAFIIIIIKLPLLTTLWFKSGKTFHYKNMATSSVEDYDLMSSH